MCRLFGAVSQGPIYYDLFEEFADLAVVGNTPSGHPDERGHQSGWGIAFFENGKLAQHVRGRGAAPSEPRYYGCAWKIAKLNIDRKAGVSLVVIAHLRRASTKAPVGEEWSHPFVASKGDHTWAFAHNGGLNDFPVHREPMATDSQALFEELLRNLDDADPKGVAAATRATVEEARRKNGYSSMNFLLTDGTWLHAFREFQENADYYTLYHDHFGEAVLVCSQPILGMRENLLSKGYLLSIGPDLGVVRTRVL